MEISIFITHLQIAHYVDRVNWIHKVNVELAPNAHGVIKKSLFKQKIKRRLCLKGRNLV